MNHDPNEIWYDDYIIPGMGDPRPRLTIKKPPEKPAKQPQAADNTPPQPE